MEGADRLGGTLPVRRHSSGLVFDGKSTIFERPGIEDRKGEFLLHLIEEEFELTYRSQNCLRENGVTLIGQLVQKTATELLALKNFGRRSLGEIEAELAIVGLALGTALEFPPWSGDERDVELIRILATQRVGGGFFGESGESPSASRGDALLHYSEQVLRRLESDFLDGRPYLIPLIRRQRIWLQDELRKAR